MTLHARLTELLQGHVLARVDRRAWWCSCRADCTAVGGSFAGHLASVLLSAAGVAVVELPEPTSTRYEGDEHAPLDRDAWNTGGGWATSVWEYPEVQVSARLDSGWETFEPIGAGVARDLAAALLSAANVAEGK